MSKHLLNEFVQVTPLEHLYHPTIEWFINCFTPRNVLIFKLNLLPETNPSRHLHLRRTQILEFSGNEVSNTSLKKVSTSVLVLPFIQKLRLATLKARSSSYGWKESSLGGGGGGLVGFRGLGRGLTNDEVEGGLAHVDLTDCKACCKGSGGGWVEGYPEGKQSTQPSSSWNNPTIYALSQELSIRRHSCRHTPPFLLTT